MLVSWQLNQIEAIAGACCGGSRVSLCTFHKVVVRLTAMPNQLVCSGLGSNLLKRYELSLLTC